MTSDRFHPSMVVSRWPFRLSSLGAMKAPEAQAPRSELPAAAPSQQTDDLAFFEKKARLSKELGATHMLVTEGLPPATWEMDPTTHTPCGLCIMRACC